jgi:hypothetical protein
MLDVRDRCRPPPDELPEQGEVIMGLALMATFALAWTMICVAAGAFVFGPAVCS